MKGKGFVTALGTPLDDRGYFLPDSLRTHVEQQQNAGAAALLCMGSMGQQPAVYLASEQAGMVNCCTLRVDGGWTAW